MRPGAKDLEAFTQQTLTNLFGGDSVNNLQYSSSSPLLLSSLELIDTKVYEPEVRALLGTASQLTVHGFMIHSEEWW